MDELIYVDRYPPADAKTPVVRRERHCGGLAATALVAAARLGSSCAYAGVLGTDEPSDFAAGRMAAEGVDMSHARRRDDARIVWAVIVVDESSSSRNIFFDLNGVVGADADWPPPSLIQSARVLLVDHVGIEGMIRAAKIAQDAKIPVVADLEDDRVAGFADLLELVDHLVISQAFAERLTGEADPGAAAAKLWTGRRAAVMVTCGADGCWWFDGAEGKAAQHHPAIDVDAVDTTGCGDVFHGAYASALARGLDLHERIRFASAAAAIKATRRGGQDGIPVRSAVEQFLAEHGG